MRIIQLTLLLICWNFFIFIGQVDEQYIKIGFYCSLIIIAVIGLFIDRIKNDE